MCYSHSPRYNHRIFHFPLYSSPSLPVPHVLIRLRLNLTTNAFHYNLYAMSRYYNILKILILSLLIQSSFSKCSTGGNSCKVDQDCPDGEICIDSRCVSKNNNNNKNYCTYNEECPAGNVCVGGYCSPGVRCNTDQDCPSGSFCNVMFQRCEVTTNGCSSDADCPNGEFCNFQTGECESSNQCFSDQDCNQNQYCDPSDHICKEKDTVCNSDSDCPEGYICDLQNGICQSMQTGCNSNSDCQSGYHCDLQSNECIPDQSGCTNDSDCQNGQICQDGSCVEQTIPNGVTLCTVDSDCEQGKICIKPESAISGLCTVACNSDSDCNQDEKCDTVVVSQNGQRPSFCYKNCSHDTDCPSSSFSCIPPDTNNNSYRGNICLPNSWTGSSGQNGYCYSSSCDSLNYCPNGQICIAFGSNQSQGFCFEDCSNSGYCSLGGQCVDLGGGTKFCDILCNSSLSCPSGWICSSQ